MNDYTPTDYVNAFRNLNLQPYQRRMLEIHYCAPNHTLTATQMAKAMGFRNWGGANLHYGVLGKLVAEMLGWHPMPETALYVLAEFEKPGREWHWIMRSPVASAMEILGWAKTEQSRIPERLRLQLQYMKGRSERYVLMHTREVVSLESNVSCTTAVNAPHVVLFWLMFMANQPKAIFMSTTYGSCPKSEKATTLILSATYYPYVPTAMPLYICGNLHIQSKRSRISSMLKNKMLTMRCTRTRCKHSDDDHWG